MPTGVYVRQIKDSVETKVKRSISLKKKYASQWGVRKRLQSSILRGEMNRKNKGKTFEELHGVEGAKRRKRKISAGNRGKVPWNKGLIKEDSESLCRLGDKVEKVWERKGFRARMSVVQKGVWNRKSDIEKREFSEMITARNNDVEYKKRWLRKFLKAVQTKPNEFEKRCERIIERSGEFEYVGDGSVLIGGRSPDFIDRERRIVVLCHGIYWHLLKYGLEDTEENRRIIEKRDSKVFKDNGWNVKVIWEGYEY